MFKLSCWMGGVCMLYSGVMPMIYCRWLDRVVYFSALKPPACGRDQSDKVSPLCHCPVMSWRGILGLPKPGMLPKFSANV